jgi:mRNA interferase HigB
MRVIALRSLTTFWATHTDAEGPLLSWYAEAVKAEWKNPGQLKIQYKNASLLTSKRVVFNIKGNSYRLIVDIEYRLQIIFIVWIGTHRNYNGIDAKTIRYDKTNKK